MSQSAAESSIVILSAARTPMGGFLGELGALSCAELGSVAIRAAVERAGISPDRINNVDNAGGGGLGSLGSLSGEAIMGCVLSAGQGQAPARQAALGAGLPPGVGCTTVNKMCGSGMRAAMMAHDMLRAGSVDLVVAGGMESMSQAPYLLPKARAGLRLGHGVMKDHMFLDGLEDAYARDESGGGRLMGSFAEECADRYGFSRSVQDEFAITSTRRAQQATTDGSFDWEMAPVAISARQGERVIRHDEQPAKAKLDKIPTLKPAFRKDGTVTAANASSISDGAAALVLTRETTAVRLGASPLARLVAHSTHAHQPSLFTTAPVGAIRKLLDKAGWRVVDVDLWEINEAFAVVTLAAMRELDLPHEKVNIHGGACALGHPIGASGARIIATLIGALRKTGGRRGIASLCIGGGEATAVAIELL